MRQVRLRALAALLALLTAATLCTGCSAPEKKEPEVTQEMLDAVYVDAVAVQIVDEGVALTGEPAVPVVLMPEASGVKTRKNASATIDYSNTASGYIMVNYTGSTTKRLKALVTGPSKVSYQYNLTPGVWTTLPLSDGSGKYKAEIFENISGTSYASVISVSFEVTLKDEFAPFLLPNQYVNYTAESKTVKKAQELVGDEQEVLKKVEYVYKYVVENFTYDKEKAQSVKSGYLPDVDAVLEAKKGICFDYAAVMAAMLRSENVPTKLVVGYSGKVYHAWVNVYSEKSGWLNGVIFFDGAQWKLMDPTFASSGKQSASIMKYIGEGSNYQEKYLY